MERILFVAEDESKSPPPIQTVGTGGLMQARVGRERTRYDLFFTDKRIIAASLFSTADLSGWGPAAQFQTIAAGVKWKKMKAEKRSQFAGKTPDEILHLDQNSFELPYQYIQSAQVVKKLGGGKLIIHVNVGGRIDVVELPAPKNKLNDIQNILNMYMPGRVR